MNSEVPAGAPNAPSLAVASPAPELSASSLSRSSRAQARLLVHLWVGTPRFGGGTELKGFLPAQHLQSGNCTVSGARKAWSSPRAPSYRDPAGLVPAARLVPAPGPRAASFREPPCCCLTLRFPGPRERGVWVP